MKKVYRLKTILTIIKEARKNCDGLLDYDEEKYLQSKKLNEIKFELYVLTINVMDDLISDKDFEYKIQKIENQLYKLTLDELDYITSDYQKMLNIRKEAV